MKTRAACYLMCLSLPAPALAQHDDRAVYGIADEPRGSMVVDFTAMRSDAQAIAALELAGLTIVSRDGDQAGLADVSRGAGFYEKALVHASPDGNSRGSALYLQTTRAVERIVLLGGNGLAPADLTGASPATARLIGLGPGDEVLALDQRQVQGRARTRLAIEASPAPEQIVLCYGASTQEEAVAAVAVSAAGWPELPLPQASAVGPRSKLRAAWLSQHAGEIAQVRILATLRHTDARNPSQVPFSFVLRSVLKIVDPESGAVLRALAAETQVPQAAVFRDGPRGRVASVEIAIPWDHQDAQGQPLALAQVDQVLELTALRIGQPGANATHFVDSVVLRRRAAESPPVGISWVDGALIGRALMARPPLSASAAQFDRLRTRLRANPEAAALFLDAALDRGRGHAERTLAIWYLLVLGDKALAEMITPLTDDPDPSVAAAAEDLILLAAGW